MEALGVLAAAAAVHGEEWAVGHFGCLKVVSDQAGAGEDDPLKTKRPAEAAKLKDPAANPAIGFDRDAFLATARRVCQNDLGPVFGASLSFGAAEAPRL